MGSGQLECTISWNSSLWHRARVFSFASTGTGPVRPAVDPGVSAGPGAAVGVSPASVKV